MNNEELQQKLMMEYIENFKKMQKEGEDTHVVISDVLSLRKEGFQKGYGDYKKGLDCVPEDINGDEPDEFNSYKEGYISGYKASEMDLDATLESKVQKVNLELFQSCEHEECLSLEENLDEEYHIQSPYVAMGANTLKGHIISANPWIGERVLVYHNRTMIWTHAAYSNRITKHSYTQEMIYNCMHPCEQKAYDSLPEVFEVYRGYAYPKTEEFSQSFAEQASSWTVDKSVAEFFTEYHTKMKKGALETALITAIMKKSDVLFVMLDRKESEVLTYADRNVKITNVAISYK